MYCQTYQAADYTQWQKIDLWEIQEAICLILGKEPKAHMFLYEKESRDHSPFWKKFEAIEKMTEASIICGKLETYTRPPNFLYCRVTPSIFLRWAQRKNLKIPSDLMDLIPEEKKQELPNINHEDNIPQLSEIPIEEKKSTSQIDRLICQAIAQTLWDIYPEMTIVAMTKHHAIQTYGSGKLYKGKNTLRDWLNKVDPRDSKTKTGRPKKLIPV